MPLSDWWSEAFPSAPHQPKPPGAKQMLTLIAYDIADPKRLRRIAQLCESYGARVQYSVFECRLESRRVEILWQKLIAEIDPKEDRLVAYVLDTKAAKRTRTAGTMVCSSKAICYII